MGPVPRDSDLISLAWDPSICILPKALQTVAATLQNLGTGAMSRWQNSDGMRGAPLNLTLPSEVLVKVDLGCTPHTHTCWSINQSTPVYNEFLTMKKYLLRDYLPKPSSAQGQNTKEKLQHWFAVVWKGSRNFKRCSQLGGLLVIERMPWKGVLEPQLFPLLCFWPCSEKFCFATYNLPYYTALSQVQRL